MDTGDTPQDDLLILPVGIRALSHRPVLAGTRTIYDHQNAMRSISKRPDNMPDSPAAENPA
jgi:hypothetical protein